MNSTPIMTVSGVRGIVGESLTDDFCARLAYLQALENHAHKVVVGRDTRPSGASLARAVCRGIHAAGARVIDVGIAPTPTIATATAHVCAQTGIIITASHNPLPYNGYKIAHSSGRLANAPECDKIYSAFFGAEQLSLPGFNDFSDEPDGHFDAVSMHIERILGVVDTGRIKRAGISIAVDSINGAGGVIFPELLERLGVRWIGVHNGIDGNFVHNPEPRPAHLADLAGLLERTEGLWGGFAFDPDADRLAPMGEHGEPISEEMTLVLALDNILSREPSSIAVNLSTSMVIDDVARKYGVNVIRTRIGEAHVVEAMQQHDCSIGGEGNGGVIYPRVSRGRDGLTALALILEHMAITGRRLTLLAAQWPLYCTVKEKIQLQDGRGRELIDRLVKRFAAERIDRQDGLKIIRDEGWVHVRVSNTEPILRCYAEARSEQKARELAAMVMNEAQSR